MNRILILTDDVEAWAVKITHDLQSYQCRKRRYEVEISTELFYFVIKSAISEASRGSCWSCAILDKFIPMELEYTVLAPCVKASMIRTGNYFKQIQDKFEEETKNGND